MSNTPVAPVGRPEAIGHRVILEDLSCHRCAYNLRGLRQDGQCPECGAPIEVSVAGDALRFADPRWVRDLAVGINCLTPSFAAYLLAAALLFPLGILANYVPGLAGFEAAGGVGYFLFVVARFIYGMWLLTEPNPGSAELESWRSDRLLVRYALVATAVTAGGLAIVLLLRMGRPAWISFLVLGSPTGLTGLIGIYGLANYFGFLAGKVSDEFSRRRARQCLRWYIRGWIYCAVVLVLAFVTSFPGFLILLVPGVPVVILFGARLFGTLPVNMADAMAKHRKWAEETWAKADMDLVQPRTAGEVHESRVTPTPPKR